MKITAWVGGHHITKFLQVYNKRIAKACKSSGEIQRFQFQLGEDTPEEKPCGIKEAVLHLKGERGSLGFNPGPEIQGGMVSGNILGA